MERSHHQHLAAIRELDLSACHSHTIADRISAVPGLRTSAAFLTFLRANLVIPPSALSSHANTPVFEATTPFPHSMSSPSAMPSSPLGANAPLVPEDEIPELCLETLDSEYDKAEGLHLVADSIAEMRQQASRSFVTHPASVAGVAAVLTAVYKAASDDIGRCLLVACGMVMSYLLAVRYYTNGYLDLAEKTNWSWLQRNENGDEDLIIGARYNDDLVGALVLQLKPAVTNSRKKSRHLTLRGGAGVIRAWTTELKSRGHGIGKDLLEEAVRITKEKCGKDAQVGFAQEHANSTMLLPDLFNGSFKRDEMRAAKALEAAVSEWEACRKKR